MKMENMACGVKLKKLQINIYIAMWIETKLF